ncbi:MAG: hypothetical protein KAH18_09905 [Psychromonas sp.]|nr:hypothetical protein [Psychromonas sp.]
MKSKLEIYALSVCFASMICLVIASSIGIYSIFEVTAPKFTMLSYDYAKYQSNDTYWDDVNNNDSKASDEAIRPNRDTLTKDRLDKFFVAIKAEQREGYQTLLKTLIFILVTGSALFIHWKIAKQSRE